MSSQEIGTLTIRLPIYLNDREKLVTVAVIHRVMEIDAKDVYTEFLEGNDPILRKKFVACWKTSREVYL